jgi:signal transduction histidine kinase
MNQTAPSTILVIDDEIGPRESLRILLKPQYDVVCAASVASGIKSLQQGDFDLVILDIHMPGENGMDALGTIREIAPDVAVVMLTGFGSLETAQQALRLGASDYLKKPFDVDGIRETIAFNLQKTHIARRSIRAVDELKRLNEQIMLSLPEKERFAAMGQASAEFVHDLNTPLSVISGYTQLLQKKFKGAGSMSTDQIKESVEFLSTIEKNVQRCCELAQVWRNLGKKETRRFSPMSINEMLADIVKGAECSINCSKIQIDPNSDWREYKVLGDNIQVFRAIQNVVTNAIQALPEENGLLRIGCRQAGSQVEIKIEDNGCGMSPDEVRKVFHPYFTTKSFDKGTGLGMFITKRIIEDHHGSIHVQSKQNKGTTVTIRLPLYNIRVILWKPHEELTPALS